jgi:uncharacterized iron-regulated protein
MAFSVLLLVLMQPLPAPVPIASYVPERVYDTRRSAFADFEMMLADLAGADVVFVGEQHDDPNTHRLEHAILDGLRRRSIPLTVSFEMFERDVQGTVDKYLGGTINEAEFLKDTRPWPRYVSDYRPLVELAKAQGWPVLAANVPRRYAAEVAKTGRSALDRLPAAERAMVARDLECPQDSYFQRFSAAMSNHSGPASARPSDAPAADDDAKRAAAASTDRYYWSQCVKDETMAESIADAVDRRGGQQGTIVHFNGAFHSDFGSGAAERTRRRLTGRRVAVVTILPVNDIDTLAPAGDDLKRADFLVYTVK